MKNRLSLVSYPVPEICSPILFLSFSQYILFNRLYFGISPDEEPETNRTQHLISLSYRSLVLSSQPSSPLYLRTRQLLSHDLKLSGNCSNVTDHKDRGQSTDVHRQCAFVSILGSSTIGSVLPAPKYGCARSPLTLCAHLDFTQSLSLKVQYRNFTFPNTIGFIVHPIKKLGQKVADTCEALALDAIHRLSLINIPRR